MRLETNRRPKISGDRVGRMWYILENKAEFDHVLQSLIKTGREGLIHFHLFQSLVSLYNR
jgi:hypothetical protein